MAPFIVLLARVLCRSGAVVLVSIGVTLLCLSSASSPGSGGPYVLGVVSGHRMPYAVLHDRTTNFLLPINERAFVDSEDDEVTTPSSPVCSTIEVLLTHEDLKAGQWLENHGMPAPGVRFGGSIPLMHPETADPVGDYTYLLTFLPNNDCVATGSYTFTNNGDTTAASPPPPSQITFTATCKALPYFSITGGQGSYQGATGHVQYQIPDAESRGYRHAIHVCS